MLRNYTKDAYFSSADGNRTRNLHVTGWHHSHNMLRHYFCARREFWNLDPLLNRQALCLWATRAIVEIVEIESTQVPCKSSSPALEHVPPYKKIKRKAVGLTDGFDTVTFVLQTNAGLPARSIPFPLLLNLAAWNGFEPLFVLWKKTFFRSNSLVSLCFTARKLLRAIY